MKSSLKNNLFDYISLQVKTLKLCGVWFFISHDVKSFKFWLHLFLKVVVGVLLFVLPVLGQIIYLIRLILSGHNEIQEIAGIINLVLTELLISFKLLDLRWRCDLLRELKKQMRRKEFLHFNSPQKDIIGRSITLSKKLFFWLNLSATIDIIIHIIVVPAIHGFKVLPVRMDFVFFDVFDYPYIYLILFYQVIYKPILLLIFVSLQTMRWAFILCAISQLDVLIYNLKTNKKLRNVKNSTERESFDNLFKRNIAHHCAIIQFVQMIERTFGGQFLLFFIINSCIICTTATQFFSIPNPLSHVMELFWIFGFLFILVIILFVDCYFGDTITQKNSYLSTAVYYFPWIKYPQYIKKNFIILICRNQRALVINAEKLIPVSMATFTKVMNWTYKCFAVLNQMKK